MNYSLNAREGDLAQLVGLTHKHFIFILQPGGDFQSHRGVIKHDDLIGKPWGSQVFSHTGAPFFLLQPSMADILNELPRTTQILYPKDIGYILIQMGISEGQTVLEAGTGSGSMTIAMASALGPQGRVVSYEQKPDTQNLARKNLERIGLASRVDFKLRDIQEGFDETDADAFFLDVQNPYDYIQQVRAAIKPGGFFGTLVPTYNQVEKILYALKKYDFAFVEVCELMLRYYKTNPARLRPTDRMIAHTGYLVFARKIEPSDDPRGAALAKEIIGIEEER
ncbi:MAG: tRNA (adenine-N1)-methyltransferase [Anaerolineales bacterium]|jgi:tRNA (adenine57-N1/adenine58-N1)-methyltransferase|uniref:tRNA (adenine-N1)-methyltransferase n=1 Tax=Candidatus Villigracilis vicinus TaxID=3140679 RepID=UPI003134F08E|nr:tRNA (adenine-N1)-methyltransferase [Anaerolineales bacterium]MBK9782717.1 tRNA (adenine-N1)-methyltransferase [Anaerolineales bacterium]